jgi:hypothetical protein
MNTYFEKGKLYTRRLRSDIEFFYPTEDVPKDYTVFSCKHIARIRWGNGEPEFGGWTDTGKHGERTGSGDPVTFGRATYEDVMMLMRLWGSRLTIEEWIDEVNDTDLGDGEKSFIGTVYEHYKEKYK